MVGPWSVANIRLTPARLFFAYVLGFTIFDAFKRLSVGDLVDLPLVILPLGTILLISIDADLWRRSLVRVAFVLAVLLFAQGHAIHLAANAIAHSLSEADVAWEPAYFLDEHVGHYELHIALLGFAALFIAFGSASRLPKQHEVALLAVTIGGYGALLAASAIEGQTVPLVLPLSLVIAAAGWQMWRRRGGIYGPCFAAAYGVCFAVLVAYGAINGGWPEIL
jgi:hypothetical protein